MRDLVYIGSTPHNEKCQQVGMPSYDGSKARKECQMFINQLRRQFGKEPEGARLAIQMQRHDFGSYPEVVCYFEDTNTLACEYAFECEGNSPENWDMQAIIEQQPPTPMTLGITIGDIVREK